jgi:hypothetical protein
MPLGRDHLSFCPIFRGYVGPRYEAGCGRLFSNMDNLRDFVQFSFCPLRGLAPDNLIYFV